MELSEIEEDIDEKKVNNYHTINTNRMNNKVIQDTVKSTIELTENSE